MDLSSPWLWLIAGLVLTITPVPVLLPGKVKYRTLEYLDIARRNGSWWRTWRNVVMHPMHWVELVRGYAGMWCLLHGLEMVRVRGDYPAFSSAWMGVVVAAGIATVALMLMLTVFRSTDGAMAPIAFVTAACLAAMPLTIGGFALILAFATMVAFKSFHFFFLVMAMSLVGLGYLFGQLYAAVVVGGFAATPMLLAFFSHRDLVIALRQSGSRREAAPAR